MKKNLAIIGCAVLVVLLLSCDLFKKKDEEDFNAPTNEPQVQQPAQPTQSHPANLGADNIQPPAATNVPDETTEPPAAVEEPVKKEKAGFGMIFVTNIKTGTLKVKVDKKVKLTHSFQRGSSISSKDLEFDKEFKVKAGPHKVKFIVTDDAGSRGVKAMDMNFQPNSHHVFKVIVKGAPGDIVLQMIN